MSFRKLLAVPLLALGLSAPAMADGSFSTPAGGNGYFISSQARACLGTTTPAGCAYVLALTYNSAGQAVAYQAATGDIGNSYINGNLVGGGTIRMDQPDVVNMTVTVAGTSKAATRYTIEANRPGGAFNTIQTGLYAPSGATTPSWAFEVQGSTLFGARLVGSGWQIVSGALTLNTTNATSSYTGDLLGCTGNGVTSPTCSSVGRVTIQFPRNNAAVVTYADGTTESLASLVY